MMHELDNKEAIFERLAADYNRFGRDAVYYGIKGDKDRQDHYIGRRCGILDAVTSMGFDCVEFHHAAKKFL